MKRRGEAPQGAPVRVMDRQSLPTKGQAQPQGGHGCGVPHQRFAALHLLVLSRRTGLNGGREPSFSRSDQACPQRCLTSEDVMHACAPPGGARVDPLRKNPRPALGCDTRVAPRPLPDGVTRGYPTRTPHQPPGRCCARRSSRSERRRVVRVNLRWTHTPTTQVVSPPRLAVLRRLSADGAVL